MPIKQTDHRAIRYRERAQRVADDIAQDLFPPDTAKQTRNRAEANAVAQA